ncbi:MAG: fused MFS/spermidine synthase [Alcanivorax sp.]
MKSLDRTFFLYMIIFLEGYIILSSELLAMRTTVPFVGAGTDTMSIIIAAVLLPLAAGYQTGGKYRIKDENGNFHSIRKKLLRNIFISTCFLLPALSYFIMQFFFFALEQLGIGNALIQIIIYCLIFIVYPIYLLGQTVPLVSNYFSKEKLSQITGKMLFFSTVGSFCGSIITTLVFMQYLGVHNTVSLIFILLLFLTILLGKKETRSKTMAVFFMAGIAIFLNSDHIMKGMLHVVKNNKYSIIMVMNITEDGEISEEEGDPHMFINNNNSSMYGKDGRKHDYVEFAEKITYEALPEDAPPLDILIVGAGGFTFGHNDLKHNFVYVDIDKDLKYVAEEFLLKEKLQPNKTFYPIPVRAYFKNTDKKFDVILLDAFLGGLSIPEHLVTKEFFGEVKDHVKPDGVVIANFIVSPSFSNLFSKNIDNTFRSVFPYVSRHETRDKHDVWTDSKTANSNYMYIYKHHDLDNEARSIYSEEAKSK